MLDMTWGKRNEIVSLKKIEHTHPQEFGNNANMVAEIKTILQVNAFSKVSIGKN
jgi:hypothetical protein